MKLRILTLIALTLYGQSTLAMSEAMKQELADSRKVKETTIAMPAPAPTPAAIQAIDNQRAILIFLDESEREMIEIGPISGSLITALTQEAGPIIASRALLHNIFYGAVLTTPLSDDPTELRSALFMARLGGDTRNERRILQHVFTSFDPDAWTIKKMNENFYLLIPHAYSAQLNITPASLADFIQAQKLTNTELRLGLKVNHMETGTLETFATKSSTSHSFLKALYPTNTSPIFCTHKDYLDSQYVQPIWSIYMDGHGKTGAEIMEGHGKTGAEIVGLSLYEFKDVLDFLESKITTKILIYRSCYAAGTNNEIIYKDSESGVAKTYSFVIITAALTDAPVQGLGLSIGSDPTTKKATLKTWCDFKKFLQELSSSSPLNYENILSNIFTGRAWIQEKGEQAWGNTPQIKLPGIEWFSVLEDKKNIVTIGSILGKTRDADKPLDVVNFFKTDPKAILLYAQDVPFELIINAKNMEAIISMIPGDAVHTIKKISSSTKNSFKILDWFMSIKMLNPLKIFFIGEIQEKNPKSQCTDVIIYNEKIPGIRWYDEPSYNCYAFFMRKNILFVRNALHLGFNKEISKATDQQTALYITLLAKAQGKIPQLGPITLSYFETLGQIPKISDSAIIEEIEVTLETTKMTFFDIFLDTDSKFAKNTVVKIKKITAPYDPYSAYMKIPGIKNDERITITDVIIDKTSENPLIYFTYDNVFYRGKDKIDTDYKLEYKDLKPSAKPTSGISSEGVESLKKIIEKGTSRIKEQPPLPKGKI